MRAVLQRVLMAKVEEGEKTLGEIGPGLVVFLGVGRADEEEDASYLANKIAGLRIFEDNAGLMNRSVQELDYQVLVVSQFTLFADCRKGRRPGFSEAAASEEAQKLYDYFCHLLQETGLKVATGRFQAQMLVTLKNDGPVTILLDSKKKF